MCFQCTLFSGSQLWLWLRITHTGCKVMPWSQTSMFWFSRSWVVFLGSFMNDFELQFRFEKHGFMWFVFPQCPQETGSSNTPPACIPLCLKYVSRGTSLGKSSGSHPPHPVTHHPGRSKSQTSNTPLVCCPIMQHHFKSPLLICLSYLLTFSLKAWVHLFTPVSLDSITLLGYGRVQINNDNNDTQYLLCVGPVASIVHAWIDLICMTTMWGR